MHFPYIIKQSVSILWKYYSHDLFCHKLWYNLNVACFRILILIYYVYPGAVQLAMGPAIVVVFCFSTTERLIYLVLNLRYTFPTHSDCGGLALFIIYSDVKRRLANLDPRELPRYRIRYFITYAKSLARIALDSSIRHCFNWYKHRLRLCYIGWAQIMQYR